MEGANPGYSGVIAERSQCTARRFEMAERRKQYRLERLAKEETAQAVAKEETARTRAQRLAEEQEAQYRLARARYGL